MPAAYTHRTLTDVEDAAPALGLPEGQEMRVAQGALDAEQTGLTHHRLRAGRRQGIGHRHDRAEEVYVVLAGSGRVKLDDEVLEIAAGDAVRVAPPVMRSFEAGPDGIEWLAVGPHHEADGEVVAGWWSD
jgi:mannose-6-phosphate isomerase-like protein (cupin superfamily)